MKKYYALGIALFFFLILPATAQTVNFSFERAVQNWTVPCGVTQITVSVTGAGGGQVFDIVDDDYIGVSNGASLTGICAVTPGHKISIVVGSIGTPGQAFAAGDWSAGGGGGSFVYDSNSIMLFAVGAGGGGGDFLGESGGNGGTDIITNLTTNGSRSSKPGGVGGNGGSSDSTVDGGAGGAGWLSNGEDVNNDAPCTGGKDRANFFVPGTSMYSYNGPNLGGYGGGGGAGLQGGGGGGGYNGGGGGDTLFTGGGGGGGSYLNGTLVGSVVANNSGNGYVSISYVNPTPLTGVSILVNKNVSCKGGNNGSACASLSGGGAPFTYLWSPAGGSKDTATTLSAGTYTVSVTDNCGYSASALVTITQPAALVANASVIQNTSSCGLNVGKAQSAPTGGTTPYTYSWSGVHGTNAIVTGLSAGTYTVTIHDNSGCSNSASVSIIKPAGITTATFQKSATCIPSYAHVTVSGGTLPYSYLWAPGGQTKDTAIGLSGGGTYTITVTDNYGCTAVRSVIIGYNPLRDSIRSVTQNLCGSEANAFASLGIKGGITPYTYRWSNGETSVNDTYLSNGTYSVSVTDINGCSATASVTITSPPVLSASLSSLSNVTCRGDNNGSISVVASGGVPPYTYVWNPTEVGSPSIANLIEGGYKLILHDNNGCSFTTTYTITQPPALTVSISMAGCSLTANPAGGTSPYSYTWAPGGGSSQTVSESNGTYTITVIDNNGCTVTAKRTVAGCFVADNEPGKKALQYNEDGSITASTDITVFPNPTNGQVIIAGVESGMIIEIYDYTGRIISTITAITDKMQFNLSNQVNGIYLIRIISKDGNLVSQKKIVKTY